MRNPAWILREFTTAKLFFVAANFLHAFRNCKIEDDNVLHLSGARKIQDGNNFSERRFEYRMTLGDKVQVDKISANLADGVLKLTVPKTELKKPEARTIQITEAPAPKQIQVEKK